MKSKYPRDARHRFLATASKKNLEQALRAMRGLAEYATHGTCRCETEPGECDCGFEKAYNEANRACPDEIWDAL